MFQNPHKNRHKWEPFYNDGGGGAHHLADVKITLGMIWTLLLGKMVSMRANIPGCCSGSVPGTLLGVHDYIKQPE